MKSAAEYRAKADECARLADRVNRNVRQTFVDLAQQWRALAEQAEFLERVRAGPAPAKNGPAA